MDDDLGAGNRAIDGARIAEVGERVFEAVTGRRRRSPHHQPHAVAKKLIGGQVIQLIDDAKLTQAQVLALAGGGAPVLKVPRSVIFALGKASERPLAALGKPSPVALYRLQSALARLHYDSKRAFQLLGWTPKVGVREGIRRVTAAA